MLRPDQADGIVTLVAFSQRCLNMARRHLTVYARSVKRATSTGPIMAIEHANVHEPPPRPHCLRTQGRARQIAHKM